MINKRTNDLLDILTDRRKDGVVDVSLALSHWVHDVAVCFSTHLCLFIQLTLL